MSAINAQFKLTSGSYTERAELVKNLQDECDRAERGEEIDLNKTSSKLNSLVNALKYDLIAIGKPKTTEKLHRAVLSHKKDLNGLTARVDALSAKASSVPAWVEPAIYTAITVSILALSALVGSRFASSTDVSDGESTEGSEGAPQGVELISVLDSSDLTQDPPISLPGAQGGREFSYGGYAATNEIFPTNSTQEPTSVFFSLYNQTAAFFVERGPVIANWMMNHDKEAALGIAVVSYGMYRFLHATCKMVCRLKGQMGKLHPKVHFESARNQVFLISQRVNAIPGLRKFPTRTIRVYGQ